MRLGVGSEAPENIHKSASSAKVSTRRKKQKPLTNKGFWLSTMCYKKICSEKLKPVPWGNTDLGENKNKTDLKFFYI